MVQRKIKWVRLIIPLLYYVEDIGDNLNLCSKILLNKGAIAQFA
jgi:hypothetical protein